MNIKWCIPKAGAVMLGILVFALTAAVAANIEEDGYAWGENTGYINLKPGVSDPQILEGHLMGLVWAENVGWINLFGEGVGLMIDEDGNLSGHGWGENVGWINFAPDGGGVIFDRNTETFSGYAWGENIGWINFSAPDLCPDDPNKTAPGICGCGVPDTDTDGDGAADCIDDCPDDSGKILPGACGCGMPDIDTDNDGTADCNDGCPEDAGKTAPGVCGCGVADTDTDGDGTMDCNDGCPDDPGKIAPGVCGCGIPDTDVNNNGVIDCTEAAGEVDPADDTDLPYVVEVQTEGTGESLTFESRIGTTLDCEATENPSPDDAPPDADFPYGLFGFTIEGITPGGATTMTVTLPDGAAPESYYKYGPTPDEPDDHWYEFLYDGTTGAQINGNVITLHFVDGQRGDGDLDATNGIILDPGGPTVTQTSPTPAPLASGDGGGGCYLDTLR